MTTLATALYLHVGYDITTVLFYFLIETREPKKSYPVISPYLQSPLGLPIQIQSTLDPPYHLRSLLGLLFAYNRC